MEEQKKVNSREVFNFEGLPEVVKIEVFNKLTSPQDLKNCWTTSNSWKSLLDGRRKEFLLPDVLPYIHKYLSKQDLDNCRQICPVWKEAVDSFLQTNVTRIFFTSVRSDENLEKFMSSMSSHNGNPFPSRNLMFGKIRKRRVPVEDDKAETTELYGGFSSLASKFGEHVWRLIYCLNSHCEHPAQQIQAIPTHFVNLKDLMLVEWGDFIGNENIESIKSMFENISDDGLAMRHLSSFRCFITNGAPILKAVTLKYGSQLRLLHCCGSSLTHGIVNDFGVQLPNLYILKVWQCNFSHFYENRFVLSGLPLAVLDVEFSGNEVNVSEVEQLINALPKTIISLSLLAKFNFFNMRRPNFESLTPCPKLKYLTLTSNFLYSEKRLYEILNNFGAVQHLKLDFPSHLLDLHRKFDIRYVNMFAQKLLVHCYSVQSVRFQRPRGANTCSYDSFVLIHETKRKNPEQDYLNAERIYCNSSIFDFVM